MATQRISIFGPQQDAPARKAAGSLRLAPTVKNDVFLNALLEMPTTQQTRSGPLKWLGATAFHIVIVAVLIAVPLMKGNLWFFDTEAGKNEILFRRIGTQRVLGHPGLPGACGRAKGILRDAAQ
jgi:hypothetical protein